MTDKTSRVVLKYEVDKGALAQVDRSVDQIEARLESMTRTTGSAAQQAAQSIRSAFTDSEKAVGRWTDRLEQGRKKLDQLAKAQGNYNDLRNQLIGGKGKAGSGGQITESIGSGSTALSGLASVAGRSSAFGGGLGAGGDILGAVEGIAKFKGEIKGLITELPSAAGLTGKLASTIGGAGTLGLAAGAGAAAIAILAVGIDNFNKTIQPASEALAQAQSRLKTYYDAIAEGTTATITKQIDLLKGQKARAEAEANDIETAINRAKSQFGSSENVLNKVAVAFLGLDGNFQKLQARLDELKKTSADADGGIQGLGAALDSAAVKARDAAEYEKKLAAERAAGIEKGVAEEVALAKLARSGTRKQVQDEVADLKDQAAALANAYSKALESNDEASQQLAKKLKAQYDDVTNKIASREALLPVIAARDAENKLLERTSEKLNDLNKRRGEVDADPLAGRRGKESSEAERAANAQITNENKKNDELIAIAEKYDADIKQIEANSARERADLNKRYADTLVDIARDAADAAADNLRKLQESREDLARDFGRDEQKAERDAAAKALDIRISAAREEEQASREHFKRLDQIRRDAQDRELEFLLDRNFLGLLTSRRQTARQIEDESSSFAGTSSDRRAAAQQQLADLQRQIADERNERRIEYQQRLEDARIAFDRENAQIEANRQQQLVRAQQQYQADLIAVQQKAAQELALRQQAAAEEIRLINQTEAQKQAAYEKSLAHARAFSQQMLNQQQAAYQRQIAALNQISGSQAVSLVRQGLTRRAGGGFLAAGQTSLVNDDHPGQRESFNGVPFPAGMGLFTPAQAGYVSPGSTSHRNLNATFNIQAHDTEGVRREVIGVLRQVMT